MAGDSHWAMLLRASRREPTRHPRARRHEPAVHPFPCTAKRTGKPGWRGAGSGVLSHVMGQESCSSFVLTPRRNCAVVPSQVTEEETREEFFLS